MDTPQPSGVETLALVLALVWFAIEHPYVAAGIAGTLLLTGLVVLWLAFRLVRRGWRRFRSWRARRKQRSSAGPLT